MKPIQTIKKQVRWMISFFMVALFLSGLTAIPVDWQLSTLLEIVPGDTLLSIWLAKVLMAYRETNSAFPFLLYGYDWLAFAHFILAILFIGPLQDPVRNIWVIRFGMIASVLVIPFALVAGPFREIPLGWRLIDCSFGAFALALLYPCYRKIRILERWTGSAPETGSCKKENQSSSAQPSGFFTPAANH